MVEIGPVGYEGEVDYVKSLQTSRWNGGQNEIKKKVMDCRKSIMLVPDSIKEFAIFFLSNVLM